MAGLKEQHRDEAIKRFASIIRDIPGYEVEATDYAEAIVDRIIAASVETVRDLLKAEEKLER